jgi:hypothetical protein
MYDSHPTHFLGKRYAQTGGFIGMRIKRSLLLAALHVSRAMGKGQSERVIIRQSDGKVRRIYTLANCRSNAHGESGVLRAFLFCSSCDSFSMWRKEVPFLPFSYTICPSFVPCTTETLKKGSIVAP